MSQSPNTEDDESTESWIKARVELSTMIKQGRSFSGHEKNACFLNLGQNQFASVSAVSGVDYADDGRALAVVDWDQDGDLDYWTSNRNAPRLRFMRNQARTKNTYVAFKLVGNGSKTNRDAIGARVEVLTESDSKPLVQTVRAGDAFLSQSSKWLHFGLGKAESIKSVTVHWPGGLREGFADVQPNSRYKVVQGTSSAKQVAPRSERLVLAPSKQEIPRVSPSARVPLVARLSVPDFQYVGFDGKSREFRPATGRAVVLNLWASWCPNCVAELRNWSEKAEQLRQANIGVVALCLDRIDKTRANSDNAEKVAAELNIPFPMGYASEEILAQLQYYHDSIVISHRPLPIPASFLIDVRGQLSVLYKGPTEVEQLVKDSRLNLTRNYAERWQDAACLPGRVINLPSVIQTAEQGERRTQYRVGSRLIADGYLDQAVVSFRDIVQHDETCAPAHRQLSAIFLHQGKLREAFEHCEQTLALEPDDPSAHHTLGMIYFQRRMAGKAHYHYTKAIELSPAYSAAFNSQGTLYASLGQLEKAEEYLRRAVELNPNYAEAHTNLGSVRAGRNDPRGAIRHYQAAIDADPSYAEAHNNLGSMHARLGRMEEAVASYKRALQIDPQYAEAQENLARALKDSNRSPGVDK